MAVEPDRHDMLTLDIDVFLADIRHEMFEGLPEANEQTMTMVAALIRAAYGKGLMDALREPTKMRAWVKSHGYGA